MTLNCCTCKFSRNFVLVGMFERLQRLNEWRLTHSVSEGIVAHWKYFFTMYRLRWYCWAIRSGGRFSELRTIYQGCRALPFALARLSCISVRQYAIGPICHRPSVRPSVTRLDQSKTVDVLKLGSCNLHHRVAPWLHSFLTLNRTVKFQREDRERGRHALAPNLCYRCAFRIATIRPTLRWCGPIAIFCTFYVTLRCRWWWWWWWWAMMMMTGSTVWSMLQEVSTVTAEPWTRRVPHTHIPITNHPNTEVNNNNRRRLSIMYIRPARLLSLPLFMGPGSATYRRQPLPSVPCRRRRRNYELALWLRRFVVLPERRRHRLYTSIQVYHTLIHGCLP